jgi:hypothetical protein
MKRILSMSTYEITLIVTSLPKLNENCGVGRHAMKWIEHLNTTKY